MIDPTPQIRCPNCDAMMNEGEACPECDHTDVADADCICDFCVYGDDDESDVELDDESDLEDDGI